MNPQGHLSQDELDNIVKEIKQILFGGDPSYENDQKLKKHSYTAQKGDTQDFHFVRIAEKKQRIL